MTNELPPLVDRQTDRGRTDASKGDFGRVAIIGGQRGMAGSVALSSIAALRTGSGTVTAVVPDGIVLHRMFRDDSADRNGTRLTATER